MLNKRSQWIHRLTLAVLIGLASWLISFPASSSSAHRVFASAPSALGTPSPHIYLPIVFQSQTGTPLPVKPSIVNVTDNRSDYAGSQLPRFEKFEVTFQVNTNATNPQFPYDANPPTGIFDPSTGKPYSRYNGITVNAIFTSPSGQTFTEPAFYYQVFDDQIKNDQFGSQKEWFYPTGSYSWKVRFAPNAVGRWQYKLSAQDADGSVLSPLQSFTVANSASHGFVRASKNDSRYFEFDDGTYFPGLGYNLNVSAINPILDNQSNFQVMGQNGIQLIRMWLSGWSIFGSAWNPWSGLRGDYGGYIPRTGLITYGAASTSSTPSAQMALVYSEDSSGNKNSGSWFEACRFFGGWGSQPAVKQNTKYHISIRYKAYDITGPRVGTYPTYGFVAKVQNPMDGNWHTNCFEPGDPGNGVKVSYSYGHDSADWAGLDGEWNSGNSNFFPLFYLALENANSINPASGTHPYVFIDTIFVGEDRGSSQYGPNIITKPSMEQQSYFMERNAYAFDKVVDLAHQRNVYLRPVIMEKNEDIQNAIGFDGTRASFSNDNFYGNYRAMTAVRWWQTAWWRYLQARWGYSTNIHSWELLNEGDPWNDRHYTLADELGKYMHQFKPNDHLVSTSTWNSFPKDGFWANPAYSNIDFADLHQYVDKSSDPTHFFNSSLATYDPSMWYGSKQGGGAAKPTIRGETGFTDSGTQPGTQALLADTTGIWLHNYIWGQINPGGMLESYWYGSYEPYGHIYASAFDHRNLYGYYYQFIKDIPLNNGHYQDAQAVTSDVNLRAWGQKDLVNHRAHLWFANIQHTWKNVTSSVALPAVSGTVIVAGLTPNMSYSVQRWNTYTGATTNQTLSTDTAGNLTIAVQGLVDDVAIKIGN